MLSKNSLKVPVNFGVKFKQFLPAPSGSECQCDAVSSFQGLMKTCAQPGIWVEYTALALITAIAAALRLYKLGEWSYFIDELRTWESALAHYTQSLDSPLAFGRHVFWVITRFSFDLLGVNTISVRLFPCIFGILAIPALYFPIKKVFDTRIALLTVFMLAIAPWHIYMSQMGRWYTLHILFMFFSLISFFMFIEHNKSKYFVLYVLCFYLAFSIHLTGGFVPMAAGAYLLLLLSLPKFNNGKFSNKRLATLLVFHVAVALLLLPKAIQFITDWTVQEELSGSWGGDFALKLLYHVTPSVMVVALAGLGVLLKRNDRRGLFLAVYCLVPLLILSFAALVELNVSARYLLFLLPAVLAAASFGCIYLMEQLRKNELVLGVAIVSMTILPALQTGYLYFTSEYGYRDRLNEAMQFVSNHRSDSDRDQIVCLPTMFTVHDTEFYCNATAQVQKVALDAPQFVAPGSPEELKGTKATWLITWGGLPVKWMAKNARLRAEFRASRGNQDLTTKVFLYSQQ
jgi:predicted membrane-bound mannosyltransferase